MEHVLNALKSKGVMTDGLQERLSQLLPAAAKDKLLELFEKFKTLDAEEKQQFVDTVFGKLEQSVQRGIHAEESASILIPHSYKIFIFAVLLIIMVIVFFVYKLFKCLSEREAKREEKKRQKQLKKKK
ncbi:uncharacterized protein LOC117223689 isoform X2 [Megalopta genalis]|uniref:uncharacterized protein LOC117223689 isoform X2 n=1 Tax=Megalopta genalis TaxID=115081 RepID=UPI003FD4DD58